jgi:hypothetical protein
VRTAYRILAMLIAAGVVIQAATIAYALFDIVHRTDDGTVFGKDSQNGGISTHQILGERVIPVLALAFLIVAFFAKIPGGVKWAAITFGLIIVQMLLGYAGEALPAVGILHAVNAFAIAATASLGMRQARLAATAPHGA